MKLHAGFACGYLEIVSDTRAHNADSFSSIMSKGSTSIIAKRKVMFIVLITSRIDLYMRDPRPRFKDKVKKSFAFDHESTVYCCNDVWGGAPPFSLCVTRNGNTLVLVASSSHEMRQWVKAIEECLKEQQLVLRSQLMKQSRKNRSWNMRKVELGQTSLTYTSGFGVRYAIQSHIMLSSRAFVVDQQHPNYPFVFGICTGEITVLFAASSQDEKDKWLKEVEARILQQKVSHDRHKNQSDFRGYLVCS